MSLQRGKNVMWLVNFFRWHPCAQYFCLTLAESRQPKLLSPHRGVLAEIDQQIMAESLDPAIDSSDESSGEESWVLYRDRPEWNDVEPIALDEGSFPIVAIAYSERCRWNNAQSELPI